MIYQPEFNLTSYSLLYFNRGGRKKQSSEAGDAMALVLWTGILRVAN